MGLTPPSQRTWTVSDVVTAAMMNANVRDAVNYLEQPPMFSARQTATATATGATPAWTTIGFDSIDGDPYSGWNASSVVWYVPFASWWQTTVRVAFAFNATGFRGAGIGYSATTPDANAQVLLPAVPSSGNATTLEVTDTRYVAAGGYIRALGYQNSGAALNTATQCKFDIRAVHS